VKQVIESLWDNNSPPIVLVGHSMGGALAVHAASLDYVKNLLAVVVIDVVEGSAMEALTSMQTFLQGRPKHFNSIEQAIEYTYASISIVLDLYLKGALEIKKNSRKCVVKQKHF
jgi:protein phosphatase methylesterase 1